MMDEAILAGVLVFLGGIAAWLTLRVFRPSKPGPENEEKPPCKIAGCHEDATEPRLVVDVWARDKIFGNRDRLHGRVPRFKVLVYRDQEGNPEKNRYCKNHSRQVAERLHGAISEARARAGRVSSEVFDTLTELNRGGIEDRIAGDERQRREGGESRAEVRSIPTLGSGTK